MKFIVAFVIISWWIGVVLFAKASVYPSQVDEPNDYGEKRGR